MSPRWGLGVWGFGVSINMSPRWGCVGSFIVANDLLMPQSNESESLIEEVSDMKFTAVYKKVPEGYIGFVQELPGANTQGKTLDETRANLQEAIEMTLEANRILTEESTLQKRPQLV